MGMLKNSYAALLIVLLTACSDKPSPGIVGISEERANALKAPISEESENEFNAPVMAATNEESIMVSLREMAAIHPELKQDLFKASNVIAHHSLLSVDHSDLNLKSAEDIKQKAIEIYLGRVNGMTADEIIAEMQRIEAIR